MNKKILTPLFIAASFLLIGCSSDTIVARPSWIDEQIINGKDLKDNKMKEIYDAIKKLGDTNPSVLTKVLYTIAQKQLGYFSKTGDEESIGYYGTDGAATDDQVKAFIEKHPIYKASDKGIKKANDGKFTEIEFQSKDKIEISRDLIAQRYSEIKEDIFEKLFNEIKGGSYTKDGEFIEKKFTDYLKKELYTTEDADSDPIIIMPKAYNETWEDYTKKYLNLKLEAAETDITKSPRYGDYIKRKILPELYRTYLVQVYVREQRYSNLGRSYARKINMVTVDASSLDNLKIRKLFNAFVKTYITNQTGDNYDLETLAKVMRGFILETGDGDLKKLIESADFVRATSTDGVELKWKDETGITYLVYKDTKLGDLAKKLDDVCVIPNDGVIDLQAGKFTLKKKPDESAYNDLTGSGKYPVSHGLLLKEREARVVDYTQEGWFLKNGGLTDLNSDIRDRLFNIKTARNLDDYTEDENRNAKYYTINIDGESKQTAFLTHRVQSTDPEKELVIDADNKFTIIQIDEAISVSKMTYDTANQNSYLYLKADENATTSTKAMNKTIKELVEITADGDTYKQNAEQYYLMISDIVFYDQDVYDYFKSQFPDLFK